MHCYVHRERDAIGNCKSCQKGLCPDCAVDMGHSITCKGECERRAAALEKLVKRNIALSDAQRRVRYLYPAFIIVMSLAMLGWGLSYGAPFNYISVLGIVMLVYGLMFLRTNLRWAAESRASGGD